MKVSLSKFGSAKAAAASPGKMKAGDTPLEIDLEVGGPGDSVTVSATTAGGGKMDPSAIATLTVVAGDATILGIDAPVGFRYAEHPLRVGTVVNTLTGAANDGSWTFTITDSVTVRQTPTGLVADHSPTIV